MALPSPNLDDRRFEDLVKEAKERISQTCPRWNDLAPSDPGMVLLEVFSYLTDLMLYRLNRIPEKVFIEFLNLMGVQMKSSSASGTMLLFSREDTSQSVEIPQGVRVAADHASDGGEPAIFRTHVRAMMEVGQESIVVPAYHYDAIDAELLAVATGAPGQYYDLKMSPVISEIDGNDDFVVGVEINEEDDGEWTRKISWNGKTFAIWQEVAEFSNLPEDKRVYVVDRRFGRVSFAPAIRSSDETGGLSDEEKSLASAPAKGREIRAWYRYGGGLRGNVPANSLTVMKDNIPGIEVTNEEASTGGVNEESLENALVRGPQELRTLNRAITASDFELLAVGCTGSVARAKALTASDHWVYAKPGTVDVVLVPYIDVDQRESERITAFKLQEKETDDARKRVHDYLNQRRALGTNCEVRWAKYKTIRIRARVVVQNQENLQSLRQRIHQRLNRVIQPLSTSLNPTGWPFGEPMYSSEIYNILLDEPGVIYVDRVRLLDDEVPDKEVHSISADYFQESLWYAADGDKLYRSSNDGVGWEVIYRFHDQEIHLVKGHQEVPGMIAVVVEDEEGWQIYVSRDCGESWLSLARLNFRVRDFAWYQREGKALMFLATDQGLYEIQVDDQPIPLPIMVDAQKPAQGFWTVEVSCLSDGQMLVATSAQDQGGVYLSRFGGKSQTYDNIGLDQDDVRVLKIQKLGANRYLWAGLYSYGDLEGNGCFRIELDESLDSFASWMQLSDEWMGGSCFALDFVGAKIFAATHHGGVLELDMASREPFWKNLSIDCGLALRDVGRFHPVYAISSSKVKEGYLLASGPTGVFRTHEESEYGQYEFTSASEFLEKLTLPSTWLFCSGEHEIEVLHEYETK